jgi:hypothetical protein
LNLISGLSRNGVRVTTGPYAGTRISANNNVTTSAVANTSGFVLSEHASSLSDRHCFQAIVSNPMQNLSTKQTVDFGSVNQTTNSSVGTAAGILLNTNSYDGFWISTFNDLRTMQGNVSVYGYN